VRAAGSYGARDWPGGGRPCQTARRGVEEISATASRLLLAACCPLLAARRLHRLCPRRPRRPRPPPALDHAPHSAPRPRARRRPASAPVCPPPSGRDALPVNRVGPCIPAARRQAGQEEAPAVCAPLAEAPARRLGAHWRPRRPV
jgi:hypothetical protein